MLKKRKFTLTWTIFRESNLRYDLLVKKAIWRNFFQSTIRVKFRNFHTVIYSLTRQRWCMHPLLLKRTYFLQCLVDISFSFCAQQSWILNGKIRLLPCHHFGNILKWFWVQGSVLIYYLYMGKSAHIRTIIWLWLMIFLEKIMIWKMLLKWR